MWKTKTLIESNLVRNITGNNKSFYKNVSNKRETREIAGPLQKEMREILLPGVWRKLRYPMPALPQSSPTSAPATVPKSQKAKAGTRRMKNHTLEEKIRFKTI